MNLLRLLQRPEYLLRPSQAWRRLRRNSLIAQDAVGLAWGLPVTVDPNSHIGGDIVNLGVYDRIVPEVLYRLTEAGELGVDAGANVGQNCSIMALAAGPSGRVLAFEPNPDSLRLLRRNVDWWTAYELAPIVVESTGVSCGEGTRAMYPAEDPGGFSLEPDSAPDVLLGRRGVYEVSEPFRVNVTSLDAYLPDDATIGVLKIDVEGHEENVLEGARRLLAQGRVRDVVFEDYAPQPSRVVRILEEYGFSVFGIISGWSRPVLLDLDEPELLSNGDYPPNFLATRSPSRVHAKLGPAGWKCLRARAHKRR